MSVTVFIGVLLHLLNRVTVNQKPVSSKYLEGLNFSVSPAWFTYSVGSCRPQMPPNSSCIIRWERKVTSHSKLYNFQIAWRYSLIRPKNSVVNNVQSKRVDWFHYLLADFHSQPEENFFFRLAPNRIVVVVSFEIRWRLAEVKRYYPSRTIPRIGFE